MELGGVYRPAVVMVPEPDAPPSIESTNHLTVPPVALNCCVWLTNTTAVRGAMDNDVLPEVDVTSLAESLALLVSPPPPTVAVFVTLAGAELETFTVRVITA